MSCLWADQSDMAGVMVLNLFTAPCFIFELTLIFFYINFPVTALGPDPMSGAYLNNTLFLQCPLAANSSTDGVHQVRCFFAYIWKQRLFPKHHASFKKLGDGQSPKKWRPCQLLQLCFVLWDSMTLEDGTKRLSQNVGKESPLHTAQYLRRAWISHDNMAMQTVVLLRMVWFKEIWFGAVQVSTWFSNLRPHIFEHQI